MPDFLSVLTDGTVGGELCSGSHVHQTLAAEGHAVGVIAVDLQLLVEVGSVVQQQVVVVSLVPVGAVQQSVEQVTLAVIGGHGAVHQGVDGTAQVGIGVVNAPGIVGSLCLVDLLDGVAEDIWISIPAGLSTARRYSSS